MQQGACRSHNWAQFCNMAALLQLDKGQRGISAVRSTANFVENEKVNCQQLNDFIIKLELARTQKCCRKFNCALSWDEAVKNQKRFAFKFEFFINILLQFLNCLGFQVFKT